MNEEFKPYKVNDAIYFDENLLTEFSKESNIPIVQPLGNFNLAIKLQKDQEPCIHDIGYPAMILRYILKDYLKEDYDVFLADLFDRLKRYGNFINVNFNRIVKRSMHITLATGYQSIKEISSFGFKYEISTRNWTYDTVETDIVIVFEGESFYNLTVNKKKVTALQMVINYNDLNGFFIKFFERYKNRFAKKLGVQSSTDLEKMLLLVDMTTF